MKYKPEDLIDYADSTHRLTCSGCGFEGKITGIEDVYDSLDVWFEEGWRATHSNCYCPKCADRRLKKTKKETHPLKEWIQGQKDLQKEYAEAINKNINDLL